VDHIFVRAVERFAIGSFATEQYRASSDQCPLLLQ
jgi:hypothetical protein